MNLIAIVLALLAFAVFLCAYFKVPRQWASTALGLALLTAAWVAQLIFVGMHQYAVR